MVIGRTKNALMITRICSIGSIGFLEGSEYIYKLKLYPFCSKQCTKNYLLLIQICLISIFIMNSDTNQRIILNSKS